MGTQVVPRSFAVLAGPQSTQVLAANGDRKFLQLQNRGSGAAVYQFGQHFTDAASGEQTLSFDRVPTSGSWKLTAAAAETTALAFDASAGDIQAALEALATVGAGNVLVSGSYENGFDVRFQGALASLPAPVLTVTSNTLKDGTVAQSSIQNIIFATVPTGGTWKIKFKDSVSAQLDFSISDDDLAAVLEALPDVDGGVDLVTQDPVTKNFTISLNTSPLENLAQPLFEIVDNGLTNDEGLASEVDVLIVQPEPLQGTYQLMSGEDTTGEIGFDASAAGIQAVLEQLPSIDEGNVAVAGASLKTGMTVTFQGGKANMAVDPIEILNTTQTPLHPDLLQEPQRRPGNELVIETVRSVVGHGLDAVEVTVMELQPGVSPADVVATVAVVSAGNAQPTEGIVLSAGEITHPLESAVPTAAMFMIAENADTPVTIWEG